MYIYVRIYMSDLTTKFIFNTWYVRLTSNSIRATNLHTIFSLESNYPQPSPGSQYHQPLPTGHNPPPPTHLNATTQGSAHSAPKLYHCWGVFVASISFGNSRTRPPVKRNPPIPVIVFNIFNVHGRVGWPRLPPNRILALLSNVADIVRGKRRGLVEPWQKHIRSSRLFATPWWRCEVEKKTTWKLFITSGTLNALPCFKGLNLY